MSFATLLRDTVGAHGDRVAVTSGEIHRTYSELWAAACRLANALLSLGLRAGDRVATLGDNSDGSIEISCGLALAGLVRCPMYTQNPSAVHLYMLNAVEAAALIVEGAYYPEVSGRLAEAPSVRQVIVRGEPRDGTLSYADLVGGANDREPGVVVDEDAPHIIRFSSGTTGRPKGILHTARGWKAMGREFQQALPRFTADDAYLAAGPLSHAAGLLSWPVISSGARHVIMPKFDVDEFIELVAQERCTLTLLVPTMIQRIVNHPDASRHDLSSLRAIFYGAAPISERTLTDAIRLWGPVLHQLYGQSEAPAITVLPARHHDDGDKDAARWRRSAGRPTSNTTIKILDDNDRELPVGGVGEICARTPGMMREIWRDPIATAERMTPDGYVRTRDVGSLDQDGFLYLSDRKEDLIISGGFNIWPAEVENALCSHPAVLEAAVVGVPDENWGETVLAAVVLRDGCQADAADLIGWCRDRIGAVKKPTRIEFSKEPLPKSGVGKVMRRAIREKYWKDEVRAIRGA